MKNKRLIFIMMVVSAIVFVIMAIFIVIKSVISIKNQNEYNNLASSYASGIELDDNDNTDSSNTDSSNTDFNQSATISEVLDDTLVDNPIDFDSLIEKNSDIYSWLVIPDTNINYPVLQSNVNDNFYLDRGLDKNYSFAGSIFSQVCNSMDYSDRVTVLYGHNLLDGTMFAHLHKFADKSFFDGHQYMYVYTPEKKLTYEIVSAFLYDDRHIMNSFDFSDDEVFLEFLNSVLHPRSTNSNVRDGITLDTDDKLLVLSTCPNYVAGRYLVVGVLINEEKTK